MKLLKCIGTFILTLSLLVATEQGYAQTTQREKVESMRIAFITHRLELTPEESQRFWPVYHGYRRDLSALRRTFYPMDDGTDPHLSADKQMEFEQKKLDLKKRYIPQFEAAIGKAKVNRLVGAEEDFKKMLVQIVRNRREQRNAPK
ncbi:MAG: hypothetical protein JSS76_15075 [Bacteroidetes bacterium]|nr:hypothetical protein [Bacteroidota bacterium]MBS1686067.1 hypothetical protein [Bacteroidota bacterium]